MTRSEMNDAITELDTILRTDENFPFSRQEITSLANIVSRILDHLKERRVTLRPSVAADGLFLVRLELDRETDTAKR